MKDDRTPEQKQQAFNRAYHTCQSKGWEWIGPDWIFNSPSGSLHDLSAADLEKLPQIEANKSFLV